jgi:predicted transcriptional regulator
MSGAKDEVRAILDRLPEDCSLEDVQYQLYVIEKIRRGIARAEAEGTVEQDEVERTLSRWTTG